MSDFHWDDHGSGGCCGGHDHGSDDQHGDSMSGSGSNKVTVSLEFTPNPSTLKYVVNRQLLSQGAAQFTSQEQAQRSPLAQRLFKVPGVVSVMIGRDFITVTKGQEGDWGTLNTQSTEILRSHLEQSLPVVDADYVLTGHGSASGKASQGSTAEIDSKIQRILDEQIRPAVAMDGGDITFDHFEDGVVFLQLKGSCAGCPSSTATLKMGIETRLKAALPEVREVVSV